VKGLTAAALVLLTSGVALGQPRPIRPPRGPAPTAPVAPPGVREHFGVDAATRLLRSPEATERLRGLERIAATHTPEALGVLERAAGATAPGGFDPRAALEGLARKDPRALLVVVRGLASWIDKESARDALAAVLGAPAQALALLPGTSADPEGDETLGAARVLLARQQAALALASSGLPLALEALMAAARSGGSGQEPALEALALVPPSSPILGGVALTTSATIALAAGAGDLRSIDPMGGVLGASDPGVRAAALAALGASGDARVAAAARDQAQDTDPRVRVAAAEALARLGAPQAEGLVSALVADDATCLDGLRIARLVQGAGATRAAAARAAASSDLALREAAIEALGRQVDPLAVQALVALAADPAVQGDAVGALARSPSRAAPVAIETLAASPATRRLAVRAYLVRALARGETSARLDALLASLARSADAAERAVATQALVALGRAPLEVAVADPDPRVQRAAAMGALALPSAQARRALSSALTGVRDAAARQVLLFLDGGGSVPTLELVDRARGGGPDAPLSALALARRDDEAVRAVVDALLSSHDALVRAHAARGLASSANHDAVGRLAQAYAFEPDLEVRRALVTAIAGRVDDADAPSRRDALALAASLDPDRTVRAIARRAVANAPPAQPPEGRQVAWLRIVPAVGASLPSAAAALVVAADGLARPVVFDDDGYALVPGLPAGEARLRLAPRLPAYESP
jgi:HEAT repeat protein